MAFNWNFRRQPDLTNYAGAQLDPYNASRIASENMQGYTPNAAFTPGTPAEQAAAAMQGYTQIPRDAQFSVPNAQHGGIGQLDMEGYGKEMEAASAQLSGKMAREQKIRELESQISALEQSISEKTAKLQNWTGNADKIAAIEASKINSQDPTMVWRWNEGRKDAERQAELNRDASKARDQLDNTTAQQKFQNTVDMLVNQRLDDSVEGREQQLKNIDAAIRDGRNINADVSRLLERKKFIEDKLDGLGEGVDDFKSGTKSENFKAMVNDYISGDHSSNDMKKFYEENKNQMDSDTVGKFRDAIRSKIQKERDKYDSDLLIYVKEEYPDYDMLTESEKKRIKEEAKRKRGY